MKKTIFMGVTLLALLGSTGCGGGSGSTSGTTTPPTGGGTTNSAPIISSANADQSGTTGTTFNYDATQAGDTFSDADGDTLSFSIAYSPDANGLTDSAGVISGTPSQSGTYTATITANDGNGGQVSDSFDITISSGNSGSSKPNILFIISDDQGKDASAQYNLSTDLPNTPNLNAIADSGIVFDNVWVSPSCSPTRAALITGKYSLRTSVFAPGDPLPASEVILQSYLKNDSATADYASAVIGKWHLGGGQTGPNDFGLDHFAGITGGGVNDYFSWPLNTNGTTSTVTNYTTSELTDLAIDWVGQQSDPWFLWLSYNAPHTPIHLPPSDLHNRSLSGTQADMDANPRPYYLAAIEAMDTEIGRFWGNLSSAEQDNTIVIFLGDNGTPRNVVDSSSIQRGFKGSLFQGGVNVPMFISGPGITRAGAREEALVTHTDFFPTIAELAGANVLEINDGQSFTDLLSDSAASSRDYAYTEDLDGFTIRDDRYKLIENNGVQSLYDLQSNPEENTNLLAGSTDVSAILADLEAAADNIRGSGN